VTFYTYDSGCQDLSPILFETIHLPTYSSVKSWGQNLFICVAPIQAHVLTGTELLQQRWLAAKGSLLHAAFSRTGFALRLCFTFFVTLGIQFCFFTSQLKPL
jgi:hypothetical protein